MTTPRCMTSFAPAGSFLQPLVAAGESRPPAASASAAGSTASAASAAGRAASGGSCEPDASNALTAGMRQAGKLVLWECKRRGSSTAEQLAPAPPSTPDADVGRSLLLAYCSVALTSCGGAVSCYVQTAVNCWFDCGGQSGQFRFVPSRIPHRPCVDDLLPESGAVGPPTYCAVSLP